MLREITIGQYYEADSILHRLDPRVKLIGTLIYIVSLFLFRSWGYLLGTAVLIILIVLSKVPFRFMVKGLRPILMILLFTMALNVFLTQGDIIWKFGILRVTRQGLILAGKMAIRLIYLILGASLMTLTTTPNKLTDALERLLRPLKVLHVPVHEIAMMMSIAMRFIPILLEETDRIMKAQMARGADFESGGIIQKVKSMVPLLVPLFVSAFRRANDLALAMEARCYHGGEGRTQMNPLRYRRRDYIAFAVMLAYLAAAILMRVVLRW
ncbi:MAG: energy-coupling factor transporter transmembrane protein EcfT [Eubacterium sp.]|nr:energy-coupling factor transporter transmembrane protein EcfT [Eubacterium sp.]